MGCISLPWFIFKQGSGTFTAIWLKCCVIRVSTPLLSFPSSCLFVPAERDFPPDVEAALSATFSSPPIAVWSKLENGHGEPACPWPCHCCGKNTLRHMSVFWNSVYVSNATDGLRKYRPFTSFQFCWLLERITFSCNTMPVKTISVSWKLQMIKCSKIKKKQVWHFYTFKYKDVENMCKLFSCPVL